MTVIPVARARRARRAAPGRRRGQTLVEFALVFPIFIVMLMATIEFGFAFNAILSINFASRDASVAASEAGNTLGADCLILRQVDASIGAPASSKKITQVKIFKSDKNGAQIGGAANTWVRNDGSPTTCTFADSTTVTVPYSLSGAAGYADTTRCNILAGCPGNSYTGPDTIGVQITYHYTWVTPMGRLIGLSLTNPDLIKTNTIRIEPIL